MKSIIKFSVLTFLIIKALNTKAQTLIKPTGEKSENKIHTKVGFK